MNNKWGLINLENKILIDFIYDDVEYCAGELSEVFKNGKRLIIDDKNNIIMDCEKYKDCGITHDGRIYLSNQNGKYALADKTGKLIEFNIGEDVLADKFDDASYFDI